MVFGNKKKFEFDAQSPQTAPPDILVNPQNYSYFHNYKVHFKASGLQILANKTDVSVTSSSPNMPSMQEVTDEFHKRMSMAVVHSGTRQRFQSSSFHITNVEYKESIAMFLPQFPGQATRQMPNQSAQTQTSYAPGSRAFCGSCGKPLTLGVRFCSSCGGQV
jgi:hypothetical protein